MFNNISSLRPFPNLGSTESRKTLEQKFIFQIGTLNLHGITERLSFNGYILLFFVLPSPCK